MNKIIMILALGLILMSQINIFGQTTSPKFSEIEFDIKDLNQSGQTAYETLLKTKVFTLNGHGAVAAPFPQTLALVTLLNEKKVEKALQSVIRNAHPEGQIYGLLGLQVIKSKEFQTDFKVFKSHFSESENKTSVINSEAGGCDSQSITLKRIEVNNDLEKGSLVELFLLRFPQFK